MWVTWSESKQDERLVSPAIKLGNNATLIFWNCISDYDVANASFYKVEISTDNGVTWNDNGDQDGIRPSSVKIRLFADGAPTSKIVTLDSAGSWKGSFTGLDQKDASGNDIAYTVEEDPVPLGYISAVAGDATAGYTVTNAHTPATVDIPVVKKWVGPKGSEVTVRLLADGKDTGKELKLDANNNWKGAFSGLPKYDHGREIVYTVKEDPVPNYDGSVEGDAASGFTITNTNKETVDVSGTKSWEDDGDRDGVRPASITVNLMRDGAKPGRV